MKPVYMYTFLPCMPCPQAYQRGLRYPRHLFLTYGWYDHNWWLVEDQNLSCTAQERENVLNRTLAFLQFDFIEDLDMSTETSTGIVRLPSFMLVCTPHYTHYHTVMVQSCMGKPMPCSKANKNLGCSLRLCFASDWWTIL